MTPERWQQIEKLLGAAMERPVNQRAAFLKEACAGDEELRREVEGLLVYQQQAEKFIETPALDVAGQVLVQEPSRFSAGYQLGSYQIVSLIGTGGMGQVYQARDTRLGREIAVKILPLEFSSDVQRVRRFEQEARAASALNHPNIITIHEIGRADSVYYIAMELVVGKTLRDILSLGPLPTKRALHLATQAADGLAKAHSAGITHRDLKPENLMITKEGLVKILDFGLAKQALSRVGAEQGTKAETLAIATEPGVILGTVGYMSPEQASGNPTSFHSDQFSLGTILYEIFTGQRAFQRATVAETLAAIIREEPRPIAEVKPKVPPPLRWVVERCLAKDPEDRYASTLDLARELQTLRDHFLEMDGTGEGPAADSLKQHLKGDRDSPAGEEAPFVARHRERLAWLATAIVALIALAFGILYFERAPVPTHTARFFISAPEDTTFTDIALAPSGRHLAFVAKAVDGKNLLWVRPLDSLTAQSIPGTDGASSPFWSPDSRFIGFFADGKLKKIAPSGGLVETLCESGARSSGTWGKDGIILFSDNVLHRVSASGAVPTPVTELNQSRQEVRHAWPCFLPDGKHFLYTVQARGQENAWVYVGQLDSKDPKRLVAADLGAAYAPPGYLLFIRDRMLLAQRFDLKTLELTSEPLTVAQPVGYMGPAAAPAFSVSLAGVLAYQSADYPITELVWFDRAGKRMGSVGAPAEYIYPWLSADERQVLVERVDPLSGTHNIWILDVARNTASPLTSDPAGEHYPLCSPDGNRAVFISSRLGILDLYQKILSDPAHDEVLLVTKTHKFPTDWSLDNRFIIYESLAPKTKMDLWVLPLFGDRKPWPFLQTDSNEGHGQLSPDGRWMAYTSDESGAQEVYVLPFPASGRKLQISTNGGAQPRWRRDGRELFYVAADRKLMAVELKRDRILEPSVPKVLFQTRVSNPGGLNDRNYYAVSADGQRFLVNTLLEKATHVPVTVVLDWAHGLPR